MHKRGGEKRGTTEVSARATGLERSRIGKCRRAGAVGGMTRGTTSAVRCFSDAGTSRELREHAR